MQVAPTTSSWFQPRNMAMTVIGTIILILIVLAIYNVLRSYAGLPAIGGGILPAADQTPTAIDGKTGTVISASSISDMNQGSDYGAQFWMYIKDWDYRFGQEKIVMQHVDNSNNSIVGPKIALHPTDNSLIVTVSVYPAGTSASSSTPAPSNATSANGDSFSCVVENVPLQSWFSVSTTVFQRNLDVYINGQLVKSCILPGVPKPVSGDIQVGPKGGWSGSFCNLHAYGTMLTPGDAQSFFGAGTTCGADTPKSSGTNTGGTVLTIFGYKFTFGITDSSGKSVFNFGF